MTKLYNLADKFAMKIGLEPRSLFPDDISTEVRDFDDPHPEEISEVAPSYVGQKSNSAIRDCLTAARGLMHDLSQKVDLGHWNDAVRLIDNAMYELGDMRELISRKTSKNATTKKATQPYDDSFLNPHIEEDNGETIYQEPEPPPSRLKFLPPVMDEYLSRIHEMNSQQLKNEYHRIRKIMKEFKIDGIKPPYPLKKRMEEVEKRLKLRF